MPRPVGDVGGGRRPAEALWCAWAAVVGVLAVVLLLQLGDGPSAAEEPVSAGARPPGTSDAFVADGVAGLGVADSGEVWSAVSGAWGIVDGRAAVVDPAVGRANVALLGEGQADGTLQVAVPAMAAGTGLVFRYLDDRNHWRVTSSTRYATWILERVVRGDVVFRSDTGLSSVVDGTSVAVSFRGDQVALFVDGVQLLAATEEEGTSGAGLGLIVAEGEPGRARFDDLALSVAP